MIVPRNGSLTRLGAEFLLIIVLDQSRVVSERAIALSFELRN